MPLVHSNTGRSKSRSPLPPSPYKVSLSPGRFLPPSHYAAAAGITYRQDSEANDVGDTYGDSNDHYTSVFMPVTYPSDAESTSDSSFEFKSNSPEEKRSVASNAGQRGRRQSLVNDLPQLEANLLPSLRDTIHRMTRSPSGIGSSQNPGNISYLGVPGSSHDRASSSKSPSPPGASNRTPSNFFEAYPTSNTDIHQSELFTPQLSYSNEYSLATDAETSTPRKTKMTRRSAKGSLRPPTPKMFSKTSDHNPSTSAAPSKSVRSILKKTSVHNITTFTDTEGGPSRSSAINQGSKPPLISARSRSRTDPGSPAVVSFEDENSADTSRTDRMASGAKDPSRVQTSSIPRPQKKHVGSQSQWSADESDFENRVEPEGRECRQLVVANAKVFPPSSESEVERRDRARGRSNVTGSRNNRRNSRGETQGIGLGLDLNSGMRKNRNSVVFQKEATSSRYEDDSTRSSRRAGVPQTPGRSSRSFNRPSAKTYKVDQNHDSTLDVQDEHERRREALLGIVSRLELRKQATPKGGESASDYCGNSGFAISGSRDFADEMEHSSGGIYQEARGDQFKCESQNRKVQPNTQSRKERPRTSSCTPTPTFLLSTNGDEELTRGPSYPRPTLQSERYLGPSPVPSPKAERARRSSRSPVIPQIDTTAIPAALRRHSVYHRPASPNTQVFKASGDAADKRLSDRRVSGASVSRQQKQESSQQRREGGDADSPPYAAAARERKAYGIPPSDSISAYLDRRSLPHADSDLSSVGSVYWDDDSESELSPAAETLFKKLGGSQVKGDRRSYQSSIEKLSRPGASSRPPSPPHAVRATGERSQNQESPPRREERRPRLQLPSPPIPPPKDPVKKHENLEMRRQDLILEIYQHEDAFVKRLQVFVELFILPLRVQDSRSWISGVPSEVARLFDWLEDIVVLHSQILSSLRATRDTQYPIVERIAESIRVFIPRLEVYQPYLVKLGDTVALIDQLVQDEHSDFGEFLRIQEAAPECEGWNLQNFLMEPVNLLANFPQFFSRLLKLTSKSHQDYLSTFSLVHSTNMFIRVMKEVKVREDEYDLIQKFAARIQGLPPSAQLATRERRLLHQGTLNLRDVEDTDPSAAAVPSTISRYFPQGSVRGTNTANRTSKLATAMNQWDTGRGRSGSASSSSTGLSLGSTSSGFSSGTPATPDSPFFSSFRIPMPPGRLNQARVPTVKMPSTPSPAPRNSSNALSHTRGTPVQIFVFTDLVLLATPGSTSTSNETDGWTLLKHIGTIRVLDVQLGERNSYDTDSITVEALPVDAQKLNQPTKDDSSVFLLCLAILSDDNSMDDDARAPPASENAEAKTRSWISAFRRCQTFTLSSLSIPSKNHDPQLDTALETQQTVLGLLASGLPLPKSSSVQMADMRVRSDTGPGEAQAHAGGAGDGEREERGWWSLRFQQVFRELQRQDLALALAAAASSEVDS